MGEAFKAIRKKAILSAILKSAIVGVFCALLAVGATLLIAKASAVRQAWYVFVLAGVCAAGAGFALTFLFVFPGEKKLAKRLDSDYDLNEKVQTMVEFSNRDGAILSLQRKDANETLKNLPRKKHGLRRWWQYVAVSVAGAAVFAAGVIYPSKYAPVIPADGADGFEIDPWQSVALEQLYEEVKDSELIDAVKTPVTEALGLLLEDLKTETSGTAMRAKVTNAVKITDEAVIGASTYRDIATAMHETEESREALNTLKNSLVKAAESFGSRDSMISMQAVTSAAESGEEKISAQLKTFTSALEKTTDDCADEKKLADAVAAFRDALNLSMDSETLFAKLSGDKLYEAMSVFAEDLGKRVVNTHTGERLELLKQCVKEIDEQFVFDAQEPIASQSYSNAMDAYIRNRLSEIFKVSFDDFDELSFSASDDNTGDDDGGNTGGGGDGDITGNSENVFDPADEKYVRFIDLWNSGKYQDNKRDYDGLTSDEMKEYLQKYFEQITREQSEETESSGD